MKPCVLWDGPVDRDGYGKTKGRQAHRVIYEQTKGPIPKGYEVHHLCETSLCINLEHLVMITSKLHRYITPRVRKGVLMPAPIHQTHCVYGHLYDEENTIIQTNGTRRCRQCGREATKRYEERIGRRRLAA